MWSSKILTAAPVASVASADHLCTTEIRACVVEDFGMAPNWSGLIIETMAGAMCVTTTKSSATLDKARVSDIGLRCLPAFVTRFVLIKGVISASFQEDGNFCSANALLSTEQTGCARTSANLFITQFDTPSRPDAFRGLSECRPQKARVPQIPHRREEESLKVGRPS